MARSGADKIGNLASDNSNGFSHRESAARLSGRSAPGTKAARRLAGLLAAGACAFGLAACSPGEVELEGKLFDALGVNSVTKKSETPEMAERTPLIVPPSLQRLPKPGEDPSRQDGLLALIDDPDRKREQSKEELAQAQAEYCQKHYEPAVARGDADASEIAGPAGPCRPSVLNALGGISILGN